MRVSVPAPGGREPIKLSNHSNVRIIEFTAENSVLEIGRSANQPLRFLVHELKLRNIGTGSRLLFNVRLTNPELPGEISASGEFGRWNARDFGKTPLAGEYRFQRADLGVFKGIRRLSNSIAKFSHLSFTMPGASAQLDGSYNVITEKIDLDGMLRTDAELANTAHGPKALFLKVLDSKGSLWAI